jgi:hypothetical protein
MIAIHEKSDPNQNAIGAVPYDRKFGSPALQSLGDSNLELTILWMRKVQACYCQNDYKASFRLNPSYESTMLTG